MLLRRAGAGASRLPKTLGIVLAGALPAARDIVAGARAAGSSNLPVAALNVPSILGSGAASLRECLRKRFCSERFAYRWWRGSLSLTRRALGPGVVLRVIVTLPDNFRCGGSVGRTGSLVEVAVSAGPKVAVDGALLRADELGSERSVGLGFTEVEALVLRADAGFCVDEAGLVTLLGVFAGAVVVPLLRALEGVGRVVGLEVTGLDWFPFVLARCRSLASSARDSSLIDISSSLFSSPLDSTVAAGCLLEFFVTLTATPLRFVTTVFTPFCRAAASGPSSSESPSRMATSLADSSLVLPLGRPRFLLFATRLRCLFSFSAMCSS